MREEEGWAGARSWIWPGLAGLVGAAMLSAAAFGPVSVPGLSARNTESVEAELTWKDYLGVVNEALARGDISDAVRSWQDAYGVAVASRRWEALLAAVRREIWAVDRGVAITLTGTLNGYLRQFSYAEPRFSLVLLSVFASVGLVLVAIGVYSVIAYTVARQTREIGIHMALGAGRRDVLRMVSLMGLKLIAIGAAVGLLASFGATRFIASQLTGVSPHDPLTLAGVIVLMAIVGVAACFFPAQKASRVDPLVALRTE